MDVAMNKANRAPGWKHRDSAARPLLVAVAVACCFGASSSRGYARPAPVHGGAAAAPSDRTPPPGAATQSGQSGLPPLGSNLFQGAFLKVRDDGLNPDYRIVPGDRVAVSTWGAVVINDVFVVDAQGNIFLPNIGPVQLADVRNADLNKTVDKRIGAVYRSNFDVYTNLLSAAPVAVYVTGAVNRPGRYAGASSDSVLFFIEQAGGIDPRRGSYRKVLVIRGNEEIAVIDLYGFLLHGRLPTVQLLEGDTILVERRGPVVAMRGAVERPAEVEFESGQKVLGTDALQLVRCSPDTTHVTLRGTRRARPLLQTFTLAEFQTQILQDGDNVECRRDEQDGTILVHLEGAFEGPATLAVRRGTRLPDLLNHVPVDPELANAGAAHLKRPSVAKAQKRAIDDSLFRLERSALLALSGTGDEASIRIKEAELMQSFIKSARLVQPLGRVVTARDGVQQDVILENGDVVVIPPKTLVVRVGGEVQLTHAMVHVPGLSARDYIRLAGGYTDRADDDQVIILHPSAQVTVADPDDIVVAAGDEILVPPQVDEKFLQNAMDIVEVIYQVAVSAAVVLAI